MKHFTFYCILIILLTIPIVKAQSQTAVRTRRAVAQRKASSAPAGTSPKPRCHRCHKRPRRVTHSKTRSPV
jgi:hypothetical protein